jgi:hypothetical protein
MRVTTLARRLGSVAVVAALTLTAAGCGSDGDGDTDSSSSSSEAGSTSDDSGDDSDASDEELEELSADEFYQEVFGALRDAETFKLETVSEAAGTKTTMTGEARYEKDAIAMKASSTGAQAMDMIMIDDLIYMKSADLGIGDKWLKIDLNDESSMMSMFGKATDPEAMFKSMSKPKKLELLGQEDVEGVATNHYRITMDPKQYMEAMEFPAEMAQFLPKEIVSDMWVDAEDRPRKYSQTLETPAVGGGQPTTSTTEGYYRDFGADVDIEAPPESEVSTKKIPGLN